jgi:hypothetical protein
MFLTKKLGLVIREKENLAVYAEVVKREKRLLEKIE